MISKNKIDILFSLALLLGRMTPSQIAKAKTFDDIPTDIQNVALALYAQHKDDLDLLASKEDLSQVDIQTKMSEIGIEKANDYLERKRKRLEELSKWNAAFNTQATSQLIFN